MESTNVLMTKRVYVSAITWLVNVLFWGFFLSVFEGDKLISPGTFILLMFGAYAIQAFPYWWLLNKYFGDNKKFNIFIMVSMPFLILLGILSIMVIIGLIRVYVIPSPVG